MLRRSVPRSKRQYVHNLNSPALRLARSLPGARQALFPDFIEPSFATLTDQPPSGDNWLHEVKHDGYRFQAHVHNGIRFFTRRGYDWSDRLSYLVTALAPIASRAVILDGEIIVQTAEGRSDFHALEKALKAQNGSENLTYLVFDILYLDGFDLRPSSLVDRKRVLKELLTSINGPIKFSEHIEGNGPALWRRACELELEGIVSKQRDDRYRSGRSSTWVKTTCRHRDTFTIAGWAVKNGRFDGIYLAHPREDELVYAGKLDRGFSEEDKISLLERLKPLQIRKQPMRAARRNFPKARWVKPEILVDAEFRGKTGDGLLRHASFKGVREDLMD